MFNPNVRSLIAFNTDSKILKTVRTNGVLINSNSKRRDNFRSIICNVFGWMELADSSIKIDDGIHLNWPLSYYTYGW